jgi:hypothetical protein
VLQQVLMPLLLQVNAAVTTIATAVTIGGTSAIHSKLLSYLKRWQWIRARVTRQQW